MARRSPSFCDEAHIKVVAGDGGSGVVSFARRKGGAYLGPDGGHGGDGGHVWLVASTHFNTLKKVAAQRLFKASHGGDGGSQKKTGARGADTQVLVPCGTEVYVSFGDSLRQIAALDQDGERLLVARGGRRGLGNMAFVSPTQQRPMMSVSGQKGCHRSIMLKLKILAHVGLAGFPNAGKSSLLRVLSRATPKVGDYPFTTCHPHLGVMHMDQDHSWTIADIPGLIEGASQGKGLGDEFLCHLEKTSLLVLVIKAADVTDLKKKYQELEQMLAQYSANLQDKAKFIFVSQIDTIPSEQNLRDLRVAVNTYDGGVMGSAHTGEGIHELKEQIHQHLLTHRSDLSLSMPDQTNSSVHQYIEDLLSLDAAVQITAYDDHSSG